MILVGEDVAFPLGHPLLLANPDLIGHLQGGKQELSLDPTLKCNKAWQFKLKKSRKLLEDQKSTATMAISTKFAHGIALSLTEQDC